MSWFDLIYFGLMLLLALWLAAGIYFSLREKMMLGDDIRLTYNRLAQTPADRFVEINRSSEFTSSNVREAFELFLKNFEPGTKNQSH